VLFLLLIEVCFCLFREEIRKIMLSKYLSNPDYNFEKVNRASVACGPLVKWAIAQVHGQLILPCYRKLTVVFIKYLKLMRFKIT